MGTIKKIYIIDRQKSRTANRRLAKKRKMINITEQQRDELVTLIQELQIADFFEKAKEFGINTYELTNLILLPKSLFLVNRVLIIMTV